MKKHILFLVCCFVMLVAAASVHTHPGFLGVHIPPHTFSFIFFVALLIAVAVICTRGFKSPQSFTGSQVSMSQSGYGFTGPQAPMGKPENGYGFTGQSKTVTVAQAQTYTHRSPVIITGNLVLAIGHDLYTFRDSSGEITVRIGHREWENLGSNISPSDTIEISGEVHREEMDLQRPPEIHTRFIRKV